MKTLTIIFNIGLNKYCCYLLLLVFFKAQAQTVSIKDSLYISELCSAVSSNIDENPTKAIALANDVVAFSIKNNYSLGLIRGYTYLGLIHSRKSEYNKAFEYFSLAKQHVKDGKHQKELGKIIYNIAILYEMQGKYDKAIEAALQSMKIKTALLDSFGIASCYNLIGSNLMFNKNYHKSGFYFEKAIDIQRKIQNSNIEETLNNAAVVYLKIGNPKKALTCLYEALRIANTNSNDYLLSNAYLNIGDCYFSIGNNDSAEHYYSKSLIQSQISHIKEDEVLSLNNLGRFYLKNNKFNLAEKYLADALKLATEIKGLAVLNDIQNNLSNLYYAKGDYKQALFFKEQFRISSDSLLNIDKMKIIDELSIRYETKEIEAHNKYLQNENALQKVKADQKNYLIYGILIFSFLLGAIFVLYIRQNKFKTQKISLDIEQKLLQIQMNPHFIFNSLQAIQSFILTNQTQQSATYLTSFSRLMRLILENSKQEFISLEKEISTLSYYLELQKLRFKNVFSYNININSDIDQEFYIVPPMLLQPFIENAIEHGFKNLKQNGQLNFNVLKSNNYLIMEIVDNGLGIEKSIQTKSQTNHHSYALEIINKRIELLNLKLKQPIILTIRDLSHMNNELNGTKVSIQIPFINLDSK